MSWTGFSVRDFCRAILRPGNRGRYGSSSVGLLLSAGDSG